MRRVFSYLFYAVLLAYPIGMGFLEKALDQQTARTFNPFPAFIVSVCATALFGGFLYFKKYVHLSRLEVLLCDAVCLIAFFVVSPLFPVLFRVSSFRFLMNLPFLFLFSLLFFGYFLVATIFNIVGMVKVRKPVPQAEPTISPTTE